MQVDTGYLVLVQGQLQKSENMSQPSFHDTTELTNRNLLKQIIKYMFFKCEFLSKFIKEVKTLKSRIDAIGIKLPDELYVAIHWPPVGAMCKCAPKQSSLNFLVTAHCEKSDITRALQSFLMLELTVQNLK
jgi:hypothetical protein